MPEAVARGGKHYLLYARQFAKDSRLIIALAIPAYLGFGILQANLSHQRFQPLLWVLNSLFFLFFGLALYAYSRTTYVIFEEDGVRIHASFRRAKIPYTEIEKARTETVQRIFERPERSRMRTRTVRNLYRERAICLRIRADDDFPQKLRRRLGPRMVLDREAVLPITDVDDAMAELKVRLGARRAAASTELNQGRRLGRRQRRGRR